MQNDAQLIKKRLCELAERARFGNYPVFTEFLGLEEQGILAQACPFAEQSVFGGFSGAERVVACFSPMEDVPFPIACIAVRPKNARFAEELTHRDYLGSLLGLGIKRSVLGDILLYDDTAYLFCLESIAPYITEQLVQVRRTNVACRLAEAPPQAACPQPQVREIVAASARLDALVAAVYRLSRSEAQKLFEAKLVFVNGAAGVQPSREAQPGQVISVRGYGRFLFSGSLRSTKKGRQVFGVGVYG